MYLFPGNVRNALVALTRNNLDISKVPRKYARVLVEFGLHDCLPKNLYKIAMSSTTHNVSLFHPADIQLHDLVIVIRKIPYIDTGLLPIIKYHKRRLLLTSDIDIVNKLLLSREVVTMDDVPTLISRGISSANIIKSRPDLASYNMTLTTQELEDVFSFVSADMWEWLYTQMNLTLTDVLHLASTIHIPPTHKCIGAIKDITKCLDLVASFPESAVIDYISPSVRYSAAFIMGVENIVQSAFPELFCNLNNFLFRLIPTSELYKRYGIKCFAMFDMVYSGTVIDPASLSDEDVEFVSKHIHVYDTHAWNFAAVFRKYMATSRNRLLTMNIMACVARKQETNRKIESELPLLNLAVAINGGVIKRHNIIHLLKQYAYDVSLCRRLIMHSLITPKAKRRMVTILTTFKVTDIERTGSVSIAITDILTKLSVRIFRTHPLLYQLRYNREIWAPTTNSNNLSVLYNYCLSNDEISDNSLIVAAYKLSSLAACGVIDINFIGRTSWGPLFDSFCGCNGSYIYKFVNILSPRILINTHLCQTGILYTNDIKHISRIDIIAIVGYAAIIKFGESYVKAILYYNTLLEYLIAISAYRIIILRNPIGLRLFITQLVTAFLTGFGIRNPDLYIHNNVEYELRDYINNNKLIPFHTIKLFCTVVQHIVEYVYNRYRHT